MADRDETRAESLPEHEKRPIEGETLGGGLMGAGGTAIDRGTGTLAGTAQGPGVDDAELEEDGAHADDPTIVASRIDAQGAADIQARRDVDPAR